MKKIVYFFPFLCMLFVYIAVFIYEFALNWGPQFLPIISLDLWVRIQASPTLNACFLFLVFFFLLQLC